MFGLAPSLFPEKSTRFKCLLSAQQSRKPTRCTKEQRREGPSVVAGTPAVNKLGWRRMFTFCKMFICISLRDLPSFRAGAGPGHDHELGTPARSPSRC